MDNFTTVAVSQFEIAVCAGLEPSVTGPPLVVVDVVWLTSAPSEGNWAMTGRNPKSVPTTS